MNTKLVAELFKASESIELWRSLKLPKSLETAMRAEQTALRCLTFCSVDRMALSSAARSVDGEIEGVEMLTL